MEETLSKGSGNVTLVTFLQHDMGSTSFDIVLLDMAIQEVKICGLTLVGVAIG